MDLTKIVALLETKFQGMRKDVLNNLASVIALQVEDEAGAKAIVDRMTAEKVSEFGKGYRSRIDSEIQQSNQAYEQNLRKKYDFTDKQQQQQTGALTIDNIKAIMAEQLGTLTQRMDAYDQQKTAATRRDLYVGKMKDAKLSESSQSMLLQQFDRMTFKDDADFNQYLSEIQPTFTRMAQDETNSRLRGDRKPSFGNTDEKGISQAAKEYINNAAKKAGEPEGKALF